VRLPSLVLSKSVVFGGRWASTSVLDALVDEFGGSQGGEVGLKVADRSPISYDVRIPSPVFAVKQLTHQPPIEERELTNWNPRSR